MCVGGGEGKYSIQFGHEGPKLKTEVNSSFSSSHDTVVKSSLNCELKDTGNNKFLLNNICETNYLILRCEHDQTYAKKELKSKAELAK